MTRKDVENRIHGLTNEKTLEYLYSIKQNNRHKYILELIEKHRRIRFDYQKDRKRVGEMNLFERQAYQKGYRIIAGMDEAGRGPLAGPVVAACVILPEDTYIEGINDSKLLSENKRESIFDTIKNVSLCWEVGIVDHQTIDRINILNATILAMEKAVRRMSIKPDLLLIDALSLENTHIEQKSIIKGDRRSISIAAASIIAKVTRDSMIAELDSVYPGYGFKKHKGYCTSEHVNAIKKYGLCPIHRMSFTKKFSIS